MKICITNYSNIQCQHKFILYIHVILLRTLLLHTSIFSKRSITNFCILFLENKTLLTEVYPLYEYKWIFHSSPGPVIIKWSWFKQNSQVYIKLPPLSRERDLSLTLYQWRLAPSLIETDQVVPFIMVETTTLSTTDVNISN